jgi:hypothetical protein
MYMANRPRRPFFKPYQPPTGFIAVVLELLWAGFRAYEFHFQGRGPFDYQGWQVQLLNFVETWAHAAVAIVVVTWLADVAAAQLRAR